MKPHHFATMFLTAVVAPFTNSLVSLEKAAFIYWETVYEHQYQFKIMPFSAMITPFTYIFGVLYEYDFLQQLAATAPSFATDDNFTYPQLLTMHSCVDNTYVSYDVKPVMFTFPGRFKNVIEEDTVFEELGVVRDHQKMKQTPITDFVQQPAIAKTFFTNALKLDQSSKKMQLETVVEDVNTELETYPNPFDNEEDVVPEYIESVDEDAGFSMAGESSNVFPATQNNRQTHIWDNIGADFSMDNFDDQNIVFQPIQNN